jgi:hypothetical protein
MPRDLKDPRWMYAKAGLFVVGGLIAGLIVWLEQPTLKVACLLALMVWCFARAYYFAFYVIEKYIDPSFRFAGLSSAVRYLLQRRRPPDANGPERTDP